MIGRFGASAWPSEKLFGGGGGEPRAARCPFRDRRLTKLNGGGSLYLLPLALRPQTRRYNFGLHQSVFGAATPNLSYLLFRQVAVSYGVLTLYLLKNNT